VSALSTKLRRDLWQVRGQALSIALVLASGVASFVMFLATLDSLVVSRDTYYRERDFADVFVALTRAPAALAPRLAAIDGVARVDTRVVAPVRVALEGFDEPVTGVVTSLPDDPVHGLNRLHLTAGSLPGRDDGAVVVSEAFAEAHDLVPGDTLDLVIRGTRARVAIAATGGSPEYIHQLEPGGLIPDFEHYGVMWMQERPLARAYDMEGAFNHAVFELSADAVAAETIARIDRLLDRYGGTGAVGRDDQLSHRFLDEEIAQIRNLAGVFPAIFLFVAAFLVNVVIGRLVSAQREQIAALKAFGYSTARITAHYAAFVLVIAVAGIVLGLVAGARLGTVLSTVYVEFFRLPYLVFTLTPTRIAEVSAMTLTAALAGAYLSIQRAAHLAPAAAMRPESPGTYRRTPLERFGLTAPGSGLELMIVRHVFNRPYKSGFTILGIALACAILMTGRFQEDTVNHILGVYYGLEQRGDVTVHLTDPTATHVLRELAALPGVGHVEGFRAVPVTLVAGHVSYRTSIEGFDRAGELRRLVDDSLTPVPLPEAGIVLSSYLGREILGVGPGDTITVEVLDGAKPVREVEIAALVNQYIGAGAYMARDALNRLLGEGPVVTGAWLDVDPAAADALYRDLGGLPRVAGSHIREHERRNFRRTMEETMVFWTTVATVFAVVIAAGVVYNGARITLADLSRELASMRVLGFTRAEISTVLLGEIALVTLFALPVGLIGGRWLCGFISRAVQTDLYRIPLILEPHTYAFAAAVIVMSSAASAMLVRRRLDRLDLVAVLKTRE